ncbi:heat shock protein HspQ [Nitrosococcus wardiae]|uniref:Heat shock protein HspQ n=1 Tax=Nitrosococcus wardiae TaxID=1814290 RepID=A0A4P7C029_9GAMM|nr:heat shock protein HspQ [Nitrosococcus wardiae]QBQ54909.1 heat shock protein HspQ [Nitrosococcus wardiae]
MQQSRAKFGIGQLVRHKLFHYRGVVVDADPVFQGSPEWYEQMAQSQPPKDRPWYHVLVDNADYQTYVAERNLDLDTSGEPINHPAVELLFDDLHEGVYRRQGSIN